MTARRKLKRRVRERQARTGESYVTALRHVEAEAPPPSTAPGAVPVIEMVELTEVAARLGIKCRTWMYPDVAQRIDATGALEKLRDGLVATMRDPAFDLFRAIVLLGESRPHRAMVEAERFEGYRRFRARVRAGVGGVSDGGTMLAMQLAGRNGGELVVFHVMGAMTVGGVAARAPSLTVGVPFVEPFEPWE